MDTGIRPLFQRTRARSRERERDSRPSSFPLSAPLLDIHLRYRSPGRKNTRIIRLTNITHLPPLLHRIGSPFVTDRSSQRDSISRIRLFSPGGPLWIPLSLSLHPPRQHDTRATSVFIDWPGSGERCNDSRTHARGGIRGYLWRSRARSSLGGRRRMQGGVLSKYLPFPRREAETSGLRVVGVARVARHTHARWRVLPLVADERDNRTPLSPGSGLSSSVARCRFCAVSTCYAMFSSRVFSSFLREGFGVIQSWYGDLELILELLVEF